MLVTLEEMKDYLGINPTPNILNFDIDATTRKLTRVAGSWITSGVSVGKYLTLGGFINPANNVQIQVEAVTALEITYKVQSPVLVTETGNSLCSYRIDYTEYDEFLNSQIELISETIEDYCERKFETANYVQTWYADEQVNYRIPGHRVATYQWPIKTVTSITLDGELIDDEYYRVNKLTGDIKFLQGSVSRCWDELEITYSAGYDADEMPLPLKSAVFQLVSERYNKKVSGVDLSFGADVQRVSIPGTISIDFDYTLQSNERASAFGNILGNTLNTIDRWRSERVFTNIQEIPFVT